MQRCLLKKLIALLILLGMPGCLWAQANEALTEKPRPGQADGILESIANANLTAVGAHLVAARRDHSAPVEMVFTGCQGLGVNRKDNQWWILPISETGAQIEVNTNLWVLPLYATSADHSWYVRLNGGVASAMKIENGLKVRIQTDSFEIYKAEARPHSDPFRNKFSFKIDDGVQLEDALAAFYWGTMLPSVVEKTTAANFTYSSGYVLSTLKTSSYAGSYPAVDHEFQIKGRLAIGSDADLDIVRRMIELDFKLMNDDPEGLYRFPCSVQPDGTREYHIRRNSVDNKQNAAMFPVTGNIEVMESAWRYYEASKDVPWLRANILNLEHASSWTLSHVDRYGRLWSDVYYEDQVIKDGRVTQAQAFAAYSFGLLASMENALGRTERATYYSSMSKKISDALIRPLPMGYWDQKNLRFIDWVDRNGNVHDHIHLLANALPVTFGYATAAQANAVRQLIDTNAVQFERFPSFVAADIAGYTNSEIGSGGPYDLCAAGRYWYWDAVFRESRNQTDVILQQLKAVATEGAKDNYFLGERYDMDHVYYVDGKNAHGAEKYYEYPNVYAAVLISKYLGLAIPPDADVSVAPQIKGYGAVEFDIPKFALRYSYDAGGFVLKNLSDKRRRFKVDLSFLVVGTTHYQIRSKSKSGMVGTRSTVELAPQEEARWVPAR